MRAASPWLMAAAIASLLAVVFAPGYLSFDAAYMWWMVRGQPLDGTVPVLPALLWRGVATVLPDPHGVFALQLLAVWLGLAAVVSALPVSRRAQVLVLLAVGAWPPFLALQPHLWKDVWMVAALLWSVAGLLHARHGPAWRLWAVAVPLALALATRPNAITAVLPLVVWWAVLLLRRYRPGAPWPALAATTVAALAVLALAAAAPGRIAGAKPAAMWPFVALWDLSAVSVRSGRMLVPAEFRGAGATVSMLAVGAREDSNVPVFASGAVVYVPEAGVPDAHLRTLARAWFAMVREHPGAWIAHRWALTGHLFGWRRDPVHAPQVLAPGIVPYRDNPPLSLPPSPVRDALQRWWDARVAGPWFVTWPYLLLLAAALARGLSRRQGPVVVLAASGLANALPLTLAATSAEFRYLGWTVVAALLALAFSWLDPARADTGREAPHA